jgi:RNA polymerase sigma-70 factor (ECF subfamily)
MVEDHTIQTWLAEAAQGDRLATQRLLIAHHPRLRAVAERRMSQELRARIDPEDLLQQVYVEVVRRIVDFEYRGPGSFLRWLTTLLDSRIRDAQRFHHAGARDLSRELRPSGSAKEESRERILAYAAPDSTTPSRFASRQEREALLLSALAGLSPDHRRVLELRYIEGLRLARVAEEMGRSESAAQMLCARALKRLRASLRALSGPSA